MALAADQPHIAALVYAASPLFVDADLVDAVATAGAGIQSAIAGRAALPRVVAARLPVPQDVIWRLDCGRIAEIPVES